MNRGVTYTVVGGAIIGALAWVDPLFIPLVLLGPLAWGGVEGWRGRPWRWVLGVWAFAGVTMVVSDWIINREDVLFHLVLTAVMPMLAGAAWTAARSIAGRRGQRPAPEAAA
jgi:hypothetical protein